MEEDLIIDLADLMLSKGKTYGDALKLCKRVKREIELRAFEQNVSPDELERR